MGNYVLISVTLLAGSWLDKLPGPNYCELKPLAYGHRDVADDSMALQVSN